MELKQRIIKESRCLFSRFGIKCISMDDISQKLGISKKTLYQEVTDKNELVNEVVADILNSERVELEEMFKSSEGAIDEMIKITQHVIQLLSSINPATLLDLQRHHPALYDKIKKYQYDFIYKVIRNNLEKGMTEGIYRDDLNADVVAKLYLTKAMTIADETVFPTDKYNKTTIFVEHVIYHLKGVISEKGTKFLNQYIQTIQ